MTSRVLIIRDLPALDGTPFEGPLVATFEPSKNAIEALEEIGLDLEDRIKQFFYTRK